MSTNIPFVDVHLDEKSMQSVSVTVAKLIRPHWNSSDVKVEVLTIGYLNLTVKVSSPASKDAFILRTVNEIITDGPLEQHFKLCQFLHDQKLSPKLLAFFKNGVCAEFIYGQIMQWESEKLWDEGVWKKIAEIMAKWHSKPVYDAAVKMGIKRTKLYNIDTEKYYDWFLEKECMAKFKDAFPPKKEIIDAALTLEKELLAKGALTERLCHVDLQSANCIIRDTGDITLIDYDFSGIQYVEYELAWFFRAFKERSRLQSDDVPGYDYEINFIRHYLKHRKQHDSEPSEVSDDEVIQVYKNVQLCKLFVTLRGVVIVTMMECLLHNAAQFIPYILQLWEHYPAYKKDMFSKYG